MPRHATPSSKSAFSHGIPHAQGLYDPALEHDSCGVGFLCHLKGKKSHSIVKGALEMNVCMEHRGGCGFDEATGDGAGLFIQIPHTFFKKATQDLFELPEAGQYAVGFVHLPPEPLAMQESIDIFERTVAKEGLKVLGWRDVPVNSHILGKASRECEPAMKQVFLARPSSIEDDQDFERKLYVVRRRTSQSVRYSTTTGAEEFFYTVTLSARTIVYKGMLTTWQLKDYFLDLADPDVESAMALVHSRFSTNTFPSWPRAQPFRYMSHNGEINTMRGNANWMQARQTLLSSGVLGKDLDKLLPIIREDGSDSAMFDNCLEFLVLSGRTLPEAIMMMIPEPWENHQHMTETKRAFYEYHATMMEPWDGPASIAFCDGVSIGAILDRNGLRPSRYYVTDDDLVIMASEVGILPVDPSTVIKKGRLEPGRMFLVNTTEGRIVDDAEIKEKIASAKPYGEWLEKNRLFFSELAAATPAEPFSGHALTVRNRAFGYSFEDMRQILAPSAETANQPLGAMGNDSPLAVLSNKPQLLYAYFRQLFAQVTNPAIDPIREELITSSITFLGSEKDILSPGPENCRMLRLETPLMDNAQLASLRSIQKEGFQSETLPILYQPEVVHTGLSNAQLPGHADTPNISQKVSSAEQVTGDALQEALQRLFKAADTAILHGDNILILSDRGVNAQRAAIPALLAVSGLHHHLIANGTRTKVSIVLESAEPREVHHFAVLLGFGVDAINPYLALDNLCAMCLSGELDMAVSDAYARYLKASVKGIIKTMSKMGISTVASYRGAQIFECIGLNSDVIDTYFPRTASRIKGMDLADISREVKMRHSAAFKEREVDNDALDAGGVYQWRANGERHLFTPQNIHLLQRSTQTRNFEMFQSYSKTIDDQSKGLCTLRGLMDFDWENCTPVPLDEVESVSSIVKRFKTGAMSFGSISPEAHEALAVAMNRLGGKSNTGEGGEDPQRFTWTNEQGDSKKSAIKQVASGRFGVTSHYLVNAREIQIKIAQGAKPGEGGELPGHKVLPLVAKVRGTTPGVGLISPPPHHDIYSIEDMAELIHDLKNANTQARINVKLVSEIGVGTIAAGVVKAKADVILIAGHDGGTGASPRSSIQNAGSPWELGLAETHQTLLLNNLRSRVVLETDGQLKTGRDVIIAALLGAEEYGFATAPLVTLGCLMMRVCHKNTCPVGIATQDERLRAKFQGAVDNVVCFMEFIAQEARLLMAQLGFRTIDEMVGRCDKLLMNRAITHWKSRGLDYSKILYRPHVGEEVGTYGQFPQDHLLDNALDNTVILNACRPAIDHYQKVVLELPITNVNRVVGTITGAEISRHHGAAGLPEDSIHLKFTGSAGQSLGAFCPRGMTFELEGDANDYIGKGLCGAKMVVYPSKKAPESFIPHENIIVGNVAFYGATSGEAYISGIAGERFCVRNSGVHAVIEGVGDHACEYMTGGSVTCLGKTGRNFGAGMSGGVAYLYDKDNSFPSRLNGSTSKLYTFDQLDSTEQDDLKNRITRHYQLTKSPLAKGYLDNWQEHSQYFIKVMPSDYERVLLAIQRAEKSGLSGDAAIRAAFEENAKANH